MIGDKSRLHSSSPKKAKKKRTLVLRPDYVNVAFSPAILPKLWRNPQHIGKTKHAERRDCASVAESRLVSARIPKQFVPLMTYRVLRLPYGKRTNQNSNGRMNTAEGVHGVHGILSAKIVPNTGFS